MLGLQCRDSPLTAKRQIIECQRGPASANVEREAGSPGISQGVTTALRRGRQRGGDHEGQEGHVQK